MIKLIDFCCKKKSRAQITMSVHECDWQYQPNLFFFIDKTHNKHFYARCHIQYVIVSTHIYNPKGFHTDQSRDIHSQYVLLLLTPICQGQVHQNIGPLDSVYQKQISVFNPNLNINLIIYKYMQVLCFSWDHMNSKWLKMICTARVLVYTQKSTDFFS